jgi:hypothetical protein
MKTKMEQFPATNPNSVLSVAVDGTVLYSNEADEPLLKELSTKIGEELPSSIVDLLQKAISWNSHAQMELRWEIEYTWIRFTPYSKTNM